MTESDKPTTSAEADVLSLTTTGPLVFISHDARDAELAEAFSKLLKSVSAGMIKTFRDVFGCGISGNSESVFWPENLAYAGRKVNALLSRFANGRC